MDADVVIGLQGKLGRFLRRFAHCGGREACSHVATYVEGQLSDLERKNVEQIALNAGVAPRTLQEFLANYDWDHDAMREQIAQIVAREHSHKHNIGIIDETSFVKKGEKTPGVQRQHCGAVGKHENCIVTVHLSFSSKDFHCLIDGDLFLPKVWSDDRVRCRQSKIPDEMVYRPKTEIAQEQYERAVNHGIRFDWLTFDEWYASKPAFLDFLRGQDQKYVGETHRLHMIWPECPRTTDRPYTKQGGRLKTPRLVSGSSASIPLGEYVESHPAIVNKRWTRWHVKDTQKDPKVVEVKRAIVYPQNTEKLPSGPHHLIVRDVMSDETKLFLAHAPQKTSVDHCWKSLFRGGALNAALKTTRNMLGWIILRGAATRGSCVT